MYRRYIAENEGYIYVIKLWNDLNWPRDSFKYIRLKIT